MTKFLNKILLCGIVLVNINIVHSTSITSLVDFSQNASQTISTNCIIDTYESVVNDCVKASGCEILKDFENSNIICTNNDYINSVLGAVTVNLTFQDPYFEESYFKNRFLIIATAIRKKDGSLIAFGVANGKLVKYNVNSYDSEANRFNIKNTEYTKDWTYDMNNSKFVSEDNTSLPYYLF